MSQCAYTGQGELISGVGVFDLFLIIKLVQNHDRKMTHAGNSVFL